MDYKDNKNFNSDFHFDDIDEFCDKSVDTLIKENEKIDVLDFDEVETFDFKVNEEPEVLDFNLENKKVEVFDFETDEKVECLNFELETEDEILDFELESKNDVEILDFAIQKIVDEEKNVNINELPKALETIEKNDNGKKKKEKKKNTKKNKLVLEIILAILIAAFVFIVYKVIRWYMDNNSVSAQMTNINEIVNISDVSDEENVVIVGDNTMPSLDILGNELENKSVDNDYYRFIKEPLMNVDFTKLLEKNSDTVAWLQVNGTNVNYPVVKASNNDYYLNHSFDKSYNEAGWLFADYRNNLVDDYNLIIYGHARLNLTMFGTLKNVIKKDWYTNKDNYVIKLSTPDINSTWQVFSTYTIDPEDYYIKTDFEDDNSFYEFVKILKARSIYNYNVELSPSDRILTLSTCYSNNQRIVLHAKLIKYVDRN